MGAPVSADGSCAGISVVVWIGAVMASVAVEGGAMAGVSAAEGVEEDTTSGLLWSSVVVLRMSDALFMGLGLGTGVRGGW